MFQSLLGPVANLAGTYLQGKADKQAAAGKLKLVEAESKAKILLSKETSTADWERIMAENTAGSWKDEFFAIILAVPLILCFIPGMEGVVAHGFEQLSKAPEWYHWALLTAISASFGVKGVKQVMGKKK
tara:strand:+ start:1145 stop:1531 length:387 start_codon:yes stop_codon:yes gene_type:complete